MCTWNRPPGFPQQHTPDDTNIGTASTSLPVGSLLPSSQCAFVLEDEMGLCGYALGLTDVAAAKIQVSVCSSRCWKVWGNFVLCTVRDFCLLPVGGAVGLDSGSLPLPDHHASAAQGHLPGPGQVDD